MGGGGKGVWDQPCREIMVRTALDGPKEWIIIELQVRPARPGAATRRAAACRRR
jgi:hypothetical protein